MDNETSGTGNMYDYGFRIYDPRIGKFLSVDPLFKSYPWYTPYQFAGNSPILNIDLDGLEPVAYYHTPMFESVDKPNPTAKDMVVAPVGASLNKRG